MVKLRLVAALVAVLTAALLAASVAGAAAATGARPHPDAFGTAMLRELNRTRVEHHLVKLRFDARMSRGAARYSREMARDGEIAHGAWDARVARAAGRASALGEVLGWLDAAAPPDEAAEMVREWLASPPHRHALLDADFARVGIGRATLDVTAIYTVDFASAR